MKVYCITYTFVDGKRNMIGSILGVGNGLEDILVKAKKELKEEYKDYIEGTFKMKSYLDMGMQSLYDSIQTCSDAKDDEDEAIEDLIDELPDFDKLIKVQ